MLRKSLSGKSLRVEVYPKYVVSKVVHFWKTGDNEVTPFQHLTTGNSQLISILRSMFFLKEFESLFLNTIFLLIVGKVFWFKMLHDS